MAYRATVSKGAHMGPASARKVTSHKDGGHLESIHAWLLAQHHPGFPHPCTRDQCHALFLCFSSLERRQSSESLPLVERPLIPQGQGPFDFRLIVEGNLVGESL